MRACTQITYLSHQFLSDSLLNYLTQFDVASLGVEENVCIRNRNVDVFRNRRLLGASVPCWVFQDTY